MKSLSVLGKIVVFTIVLIIPVIIVGKLKERGLTYDIIKNLNLDDPFPKNSVIFVRSGDRQTITVFIKSQAYDNDHPGFYVVNISRGDHTIKSTGGWTVGSPTTKEDTCALQNIALSFSKLGIPRIDVDSSGSILVYLDDVETLGLIKISDMRHTGLNEKELVHITGEWYKCK